VAIDLLCRYRHYTQKGDTVGSPDREWITVSEAVKLAGCTEGYIRRLLIEGRLAGWKAGERAWLVSRAEAVRLRDSLTTRSNRHRLKKRTNKAGKKKGAK
jgi:excisionase family DNA binding protein